AALLLGREVTANIEDLRELDGLGGDLVRAIIADRTGKIEGQEKSSISRLLEERSIGKESPALDLLRDRIEELSWRIEESREMESLLRGFSAGFIEPGPSGLMSKGNIEILPTGRNFFSLDPSAVPTEAAW